MRRHLVPSAGKPDRGCGSLGVIPPECHLHPGQINTIGWVPTEFMVFQFPTDENKRR